MSHHIQIIQNIHQLSQNQIEKNLAGTKKIRNEHLKQRIVTFKKKRVTLRKGIRVLTIGLRPSKVLFIEIKINKKVVMQQQKQKVVVLTTKTMLVPFRLAM